MLILPSFLVTRPFQLRLSAIPHSSRWLPIHIGTQMCVVLIFFQLAQFDIHILQGPSSAKYTHFICDVICPLIAVQSPPAFPNVAASGVQPSFPSPGPAQPLRQRLARSNPNNCSLSFDIQFISFHAPGPTPYHSLRSWYSLIGVQVNELILTFPISSIIDPVVKKPHLSNLCHKICWLAHNYQMTATRTADKGCKNLVRPL